MATSTATLEEEYMNDFIVCRSVNVDKAYQQVLQDLLSTLRHLFTGPVIVISQNEHNLNLNDVIEKIKPTTTPQYVSDTNAANIEYRED